MERKLFSILMIVALCGCNDKVTTTDKADLWTAEQKATIETIRPVEGSDGILFEMDYLADYNLEECIANVNGSVENMTQGIYNVLLPKSDNPFTNISTQGAGCSTFSSESSEGGYVLGRNYDYPVNAKCFMVIHTHPKGGYKSVNMFDVSSMILDKSFKSNPFESMTNCEAVLLAPLGVFDGMNEKGLMCSYMQLEYEETHQNTGKPKILNHWIPRLILDKCATVDEALALMAKYDVQSVFAGMDQDLHFIIADKTGKRVIVEYVANEMSVLSSADIFGKDVPYIASTNFYLTPSRRLEREEGLLKGELGYWRLNTIAEDLAKNPTPSRVEAMKYMENIRILFNDEDEVSGIQADGMDPKDPASWSWMTLWSSVYNNSLNTMDVCVREDYSKTFHFGLDYQK